MPIEQLLERYGGAGLLVNRALASMNKAGKFMSPVVRAKSDTSSEDEDGENSASVDSCGSGNDKVCVSLADSISNGFCQESADDIKISADSEAGSEVKVSNDAVAVNECSSDGDVPGPSSSVQENGTTSAAGCDSSTIECEVMDSDKCNPGECSRTGECSEATASSTVTELPGPSTSTSEVLGCRFLDNVIL